MNRLRLPVALVVVAALGGIPATISAGPEPRFDVQAHARALKALERQIVMDELKERVEQLRSRSRKARGQRPRRLPESAEPGNTPPVTLRAPGASLASAYPNVPVNDRATDQVPGSGQSEVSIAAHGNDLVASWNDAETIPSTIQGFGYSTDGGQTWVDGGSLPTPNVGRWDGDPVVTVNEKTGEFYVIGICEPTPTTNGIGMVRGMFSGGTLVWGTPEMAISGSDASVFYDKPWMVADSTSGNVYITYTRFAVSLGMITSSRIEIVRKTSPALPFQAPIPLSGVADAGHVQGSRVVVGPGGDVWVAWFVVGATDLDFLRVRRSTHRGASPWDPEVTAASYYANFGSGAPGFSRAMGIAFPGMAVDRTSGPNRGRLYLTWNESINYFDDPIGVGGDVAETESNDTPMTASPFTPGQALTGAIDLSADLDYWGFQGSEGQTIICQCHVTDGNLIAAFRLICSDGSSRLAYSEARAGGRDGLVVFTLPADGTYALRVAPTSGLGTYRIATGLNVPGPERARDHRDVFVTTSDDGLDWSTPVRVNDDPGHFDNSFPEVAVADLGRPYVIWYDWRDAPPSTCGAVSSVYGARSDDGGVSWSSLGPLSDAQTAWTSVVSNLSPNQGDYIALFGNPVALYPCWADGRFGDPDVFMTTVPLVVTSARVSLVSVESEPDRVRLVWYAPDGAGLTATVQRSEGAGEWRDLGEVRPDGSAHIEFEDRDVTAGARYRYRLGLAEADGETYLGEVTVDVPSPGLPQLAIREVRPNPVDRELWVAFTLAGPGAARLELLDVSGRRVIERTVTNRRSETIDLASAGRLPPGVYLLRLSQAGRSVVRRVSVIR
jgi:hypothetical protein